MLFAEDEYVEREVELEAPELPGGKLVLRLFGWPMGCSGDIVWRGAWGALQALLAEAPRLRNRRALELGAGCGVLAFAAATLGAHSVATDGNEEELPLLEKNAANFRDSNGLGGSLSARQLEWGRAAAERSGLGPRSFDWILGSEIVYIPDCIPELAETLAFFLADTGEALIANTAVATRTDQEEARELLCKLQLVDTVRPLLRAPHASPRGAAHGLRLGTLARCWRDSGPKALL
ncbi:unnamed protein product [Effrenium voratum]|uniref:Uncharacterized protein n=1 Tax=Effrenium voratum TaxID=2562239 RepID=A0AA36MWA4_9DINO|nr:unnamed protein product [Effrenium voratum]CAJ1428345.1 unnamed protein product [Effrenium voratum]